MATVPGSVRETLAEISAQIERFHMQAAFDRLLALIETLEHDQLSLIEGDVKELIARFAKQKKRDLSNALQTALTISARQAEHAIRARGRQIGGEATSRVDSYRVRLAELRDKHIFQWSTYYRDTLRFMYFDLLKNLEDSGDWQRELERLSREFADHSKDIFERGYSYLTKHDFVEEVAEVKSINGLQRFIYLIISLTFEQRDLSGQAARLTWDIASSMLSGVLRGYGRAEFGEDVGWLFLQKHSRVWVPALGFIKGSEACSMFEEFPHTPVIGDIFCTIAPGLLAVEWLANRFHNSDFLLPRLSRVSINSPLRLDVTYNLRQADNLRDLTISIFFRDAISDPRPISEAVALRASLVIARLENRAEEWIEVKKAVSVLNSSDVDDTSEAIHNFAMLALAVLDREDSLKAAQQDSSLLSKNFAREFPLEDPDYRRFFTVERYSVKTLLEEFESGTGVHLWFSVRRSGKTTAANNLSDITGQSAVVMQTMDQQYSTVGQGVLEQHVREALLAGDAIAPDFFGKVVRQCVLATVPESVRDKKIIFIIDEYESLFGLLSEYMRIQPGLKYTIVLPLLSQMIAFARENLLILMGQRPDAHFVAAEQNQLSPHVQEHSFPLFEHYEGGMETEFSRFLRLVLSKHLEFSADFAFAVYQETSGHPYLTVNLLIDFCDWLIVNNTRRDAPPLDGQRFSNFAKERLTANALQRSPNYSFFQGLLSNYLSEQVRQREPWLHAITCVLRDISRKHSKAFACPLNAYQQFAESYAADANTTPDRLLSTGTMSNFLKIEGGQVKPGIRLMARLAGSVTPKVN